jgi:predicted Zn-dependent peptidase
VRSLPGDFATAAGIAGRLAEQVLFALPEDWWVRYPERVRGVTPAELRRVAGRVLDTSKLATVLVGDSGTVKPQLEGLPIGELEVRKP